MIFPIKQSGRLETTPTTGSMTGLGDAVAVVAEPIKKFIINHAPSPIAETLKNCNCAGRKAWLNKVVPFK